MKRFPKSILRACCAIAAGAILVQYRDQAVMWITVGIGVVFFISAVISFIDYMASRKHSDEQVELFDAQGRKMGQRRPRRFPVVAIGCGILGSVMALSPGTFVGGLMFVLAALLIAGGAYQLFSLSLATRFARVGLVWWVLPVAILLLGLVALVKPSAIASAPPAHHRLVHDGLWCGGSHRRPEDPSLQEAVRQGRRDLVCTRECWADAGQCGRTSQ